MVTFKELPDLKFSFDVHEIMELTDQVLFSDFNACLKRSESIAAIKEVNSGLFQYPSNVARIFSKISPESYCESLIFHSSPLVMAGSDMLDDPI